MVGMEEEMANLLVFKAREDEKREVEESEAEKPANHRPLPESTEDKEVA